jgi:hypothetical protein
MLNYVNFLGTTGVEYELVKSIPNEVPGHDTCLDALRKYDASDTYADYEAYCKALKILNSEHDKFKAMKCAEEAKRAEEKRAEEAKRAAVLATLPSKQAEYTKFIRISLKRSFLTTVSFGECKQTKDSECFEYRIGFFWGFPRRNAYYILKLAANGTPIGIVENVFQ